MELMRIVNSLWLGIIRVSTESYVVKQLLFLYENTLIITAKKMDIHKDTYQMGVL